MVAWDQSTGSAIFIWRGANSRNSLICTTICMQQSVIRCANSPWFYYCVRVILRVLLNAFCKWLKHSNIEIEYFIPFPLHMVTHSLRTRVAIFTALWPQEWNAGIYSVNLRYESKIMSYDFKHPQCVMRIHFANLWMLKLESFNCDRDLKNGRFDMYK
jgi:hypothetical protein